MRLPEFPGVLSLRVIVESSSTPSYVHSKCSEMNGNFKYAKKKGTTEHFGAFGRHIPRLSGSGCTLKRPERTCVVFRAATTTLGQPSGPHDAGPCVVTHVPYLLQTHLGEWTSVGATPLLCAALDGVQNDGCIPKRDWQHDREHGKVLLGTEVYSTGCSRGSVDHWLYGEAVWLHEDGDAI